MDLLQARNLVANHPRWYHTFQIFPGVVTPGVYDPSVLLTRLKLPEEMSGATALDIGAADGFFSKVSTFLVWGPNDDYTMFWAPNPSCVQQMLHDSAFTVTEVIVSGERAMLRSVPNDDLYANKKLRVAYSFLET